MLAPIGTQDQYDYKKSKKEYFEKYDRKIDAIINNINNSSSIMNGDKRKLIGKLANKLLATIGR